jgi:hypothetical protein
MKLSDYISWVLKNLPEDFEDEVKFEINLDQDGFVSTHETGNKIKFTVIKINNERSK